MANRFLKIALESLLKYPHTLFLLELSLLGRPAAILCAVLWRRPCGNCGLWAMIPRVSLEADPCPQVELQGDCCISRYLGAAS